MSLRLGRGAFAGAADDDGFVEVEDEFSVGREVRVGEAVGLADLDAELAAEASVNCFFGMITGKASGIRIRLDWTAICCVRRLKKSQTASGWPRRFIRLEFRWMRPPRPMVACILELDGLTGPPINFSNSKPTTVISTPIRS